MTIPVVACITCQRYVGKCKCKAFPDGIPTRVLDGKSKHTKPMINDNGLQYKRTEQEPLALSTE